MQLAVGHTVQHLAVGEWRARVQLLFPQSMLSNRYPPAGVNVPNTLTHTYTQKSTN